MNNIKILDYVSGHGDNYLFALIILVIALAIWISIICWYEKYQVNKRHSEIERKYKLKEGDKNNE